MFSSDIDRFEDVLESLPPDIQILALDYLEGLLEIRIVKGYPLTFNQAGVSKKTALVIEDRHVKYVRDKIGGFRSDWRAGIDGTLHRYAGLPNRYDSVVGIVIRLARAIPKIAEPLRPFLEREGSLMLIGRPGSGKTSLLRDVVRILAEQFGQLCVVVDTSNEIGGDGDIPHPALGDALRIQVGEPSKQGEVLRMVIANLTPSVLVVDEIGYHGNDVAHLETCSRRGVKVIATLHGNTLKDVLQNPSFVSLLGIDLHERKRLVEPVFKMALELKSKSEWFLHNNLSQSVDDLLQGREVEGVSVQNRPQRSTYAV